MPKVISRVNLSCVPFEVSLDSQFCFEYLFENFKVQYIIHRLINGKNFLDEFVLCFECAESEYMK